MKNKKTQKKGFSLIEIIVVLGIFMVLFSGISGLYLGSFSTNLRDTETLQATQYLQEGLEAARSIRDFDYSNLETGIHGLSNISGYWEFAGSENDLGQFTRVVDVQDVYRDQDCDIVESGGTIDPNSKFVTVTVNWDFESGNSTSISSSEYLNDWKNSTNCTTGGGEGGGGGEPDPGNGCFVINTDNAYLSHGDKRLRGLRIKNDCNYSVTLDRLLPTWNNTNKIERVRIDGSNLWRWDGAGTPDGKQSTGTELDLVNMTFPANSSYENINYIRYDDTMDDPFFTLTFIATDNEFNYVEIDLREDQSGPVEFCVISDDLNIYIPFTTEESGDYPQYGSTSDSAIVSYSNPVSNGFLNVEMDFVGIPEDYTNARIHMEFEDLDLQADIGNGITLQETLVLKDPNDTVLVTLDENYPDDNEFAWDYNLDDGLFTGDTLTLSGTFTAVINHIYGGTKMVTNSQEAINKIKLCGEDPSF